MERRLKVLLAIPDFRGGGAESQLAKVVALLPRQRFEPHLCLWRRSFRHQPPEDVPIHWVAKEKPWHVFRAIRGMGRLIDQVRPDVVLTYLHYPSLVTGTALSRCRHRPAWVFRQSNDPRREIQGLFRVWARRVFGRASRMIACSQGVADASANHFGLRPERIVVLDNIARVDEIRRQADQPLDLAKPDGTFVIAHAGRFVAQKNHDMLLRAFARLRDQPVQLWLLGEGPERPRHEEQARQLGLQDQVRFLGFQRNPYPYLRAADCVALSSDWEGLPNVLIEAMICGTPVVSTSCPYGPDELVEEGNTGFLVPMGDVDAMAAALGKLVSAPQRAASMGEEAARRMAHRFEPNRTLATYTTLLETVAAEARAVSI